MMRRWYCVLLLLALPTIASPTGEEEARVKQAGKTIGLILNLPRTIPTSLLDRASCILVFPPGSGNANSSPNYSFDRPADLTRLRNFSRTMGVMTCRTKDFREGWGPPVMMNLDGGTPAVRIQLDSIVLLVMNNQTASNLLTNELDLGGPGRGSEAGGPVVDRNTSLKVPQVLPVNVLSYGSAGSALAEKVSVATDNLGRDDGANKKLYGKKVSAKDIVLNGTVPIPDSAKELIDTLNKISPVNKTAN